MDGYTADYCLLIFEYSWLNKSKSKEYPILRRQGLSRRCILQQPFRLLRVWSPQITLAPMFLDRRRQLPRGRGLLLVHAVDVGVQQLGGGAPGLHHHRHHPLVGGHLLSNHRLYKVIPNYIWSDELMSWSSIPASTTIALKPSIVIIKFFWFQKCLRSKGCS